MKITVIAATIVAFGISISMSGGCRQRSAEPAPKPDRESARETASWVTIRAKDGGVSVKVPKGWISADPSDPDFVAYENKLDESNPLLKQIPSENAAVLAMAVCTDPKGTAAGLVDNMNITRNPSKGKTDFTDADAAEAKKELERALPLDGALIIETLSLPAGPALHYTMRMKTNTGAGKSSISYCIGYYVLHGDWLYSVCYTAAPERSEAMDKLAAKSIQTLAFR